MLAGAVPDTGAPAGAATGRASAAAGVSLAFFFSVLMAWLELSVAAVGFVSAMLGSYNMKSGRELRASRTTMDGDASPRTPGDGKNATLLKRNNSKTRSWKTRVQYDVLLWMSNSFPRVRCGVVVL